jgi:lipopolysaccharide export system permease protein
MRGVTITRYNGSAPVMIIQARKARWEGGNKWVLSDGTMYDPRPGGSGVSAVFEGAETQPIELHETPQEIALSQRKPEDMSFVELRRYIALLGGAGVPPDELVELQVDLYNKIAIPIAALVFSLIGAPLAIRPYRASPSIGLGLSVLIIFAYWFVWHFTTALSMQGSLPPMIGAFLADALGLALGLILLARTAK